jgi:zinc protease
MKASWLGLVCLFILPSAWAANEQRTEQHMALANGMQVYVITDRRAPVVYNSLWYRVGSADEVGGRTGLSHMLEHMLFRGTRNTKDGEYAQTIYHMGGKMNAMTSRDFTMYYSYTPRSGLSKVLQLEADRMRHLVITPQLLKREKEVVKEERQMRVSDNASSVLYERLQSTAFHNSPYQNPVIGWPQDVASYTLADLQDWYNKWYHPNNATLILVGDITPQQGFALAKKYFGHIPRAKLPMRKRRYEVPPLGKKRLLVHYPAKVATLYMGYLTPGLSHVKYRWKVYALDVLAGILDSSPSARLNQQLVRNRNVASSVQVYYDPITRYQDLFLIAATPSHTHSMAEVEQEINEELDKLRKNPVSRDELNRVKAQVVARHVYRQDSLESQAMNVGLPLMTGLPWNIDQHWVQRIEAVTAKQVQWVASHYLTSRRLTVGYLEPTPIK